ncbi:MAG: hypothetical protein ACHP7D_06190, partial [Lysobacterales bacterium]
MPPRGRRIRKKGRACAGRVCHDFPARPRSLPRFATAMYPSGFANRPDTATLTAGQNTVKRNPDGEIMSRGKLLYAQSGGVTAVINAT